MKKIKILLVVTLVLSVGLLSGCINETESMTYSELQDVYMERFQDGEVDFDIGSLKSITVYENCTVDEWLDWHDNLTDNGRTEWYNKFDYRLETYRTSDIGLITIYHRFIDQSLQSYNSSEEKYMEEITNHIYWAYSNKNKAIDIINANAIEDFDYASAIVEEIWMTTVRISLHDSDRNLSYKSMNIWFDFIDNITKLQSLIWKKDVFRSFLRVNLTNEIKNVTETTALFVNYLFDQISGYETGHYFLTSNDEYFPFTPGSYIFVLQQAIWSLNNTDGGSIYDMSKNPYIVGGQG